MSERAKARLLPTNSRSFPFDKLRVRMTILFLMQTKNARSNDN